MNKFMLNAKTYQRLYPPTNDTQESAAGGDIASLCAQLKP
jgi:hypothetical protein